MKKFILLFVFSMLVTRNLNAEEEINRLLYSENWKDREEAITMISQNIEQYKQDNTLKQTVLNVLSGENEYCKQLRENRLIAPDEGRGEYYLDVVDLVIRLEISGSMEVLLDYAGSGVRVRDTIVHALSHEEEIRTLRSLHEKFMSPSIFYRGRRSYYLNIVSTYLDEKKFMHENEKTLLKEIVLNGLLSENPGERTYAIRSSKYFPEDDQIIEEVKKIAITDTFSIDKNGMKTFPLREEALKAIETIDNMFESDITPPPVEPTGEPTTEPTVTPLPEPTVTTSPTPTMPPSPTPAEGQRFGYYRVLPPTPEPSTEPQPQSEQQVLPVSESVESRTALKNIAMLALIVVIVIGGFGYLIYRLKR